MTAALPCCNTARCAAAVACGTERSRHDTICANSMGLVRKILDQHGVANVELVAGDIVAIADEYKD